MAHLNVRERRIETTIAYVGPELSGDATNFDHIRRDAREGRASEVKETDVDGGQVVSLEWRPTNIAKFNDCDVLVRLVTTRGAVAANEVERMVRNADGVVFVADPSPDALERNRRAIAAIREALAREPGKGRNVVVQIAQPELTDAVPANDLAASLDVGAWPSVAANAESGEGVVATLIRAVEDVLESMKVRESEARAAPPAGAATNSSGASAGARGDGNPLLAALRQVLKTTVSEQVAELEERLAARIEGSLARGGAQREAGAVFPTVAELRAGLATAVDVTSLRNDVAAIAHAVTRSYEAAGETRALVLESLPAFDEARLSLEATRAATVTLDARLARVEDALPPIKQRADDASLALLALQELRGALESTGKEVAERRAADAGTARIDLAAPVTAALEVAVGKLSRRIDEVMASTSASATAADLTALEEHLRNDFAARSRTDREQLAATNATLRRVLEAVAADVKAVALDVRLVGELARQTSTHDDAGEIAETLELVATRANAVLELVEPTAAAVRALPARVGEVQVALQRELRDVTAKRSAALDASLREVREAQDDCAARADAVHTVVAELVEELKKPKRGWFG